MLSDLGRWSDARVEFETALRPERDTAAPPIRAPPGRRAGHWSRTAWRRRGALSIPRRCGAALPRSARPGPAAVIDSTGRTRPNAHYARRSKTIWPCFCAANRLVRRGAEPLFRSAIDRRTIDSPPTDPTDRPNRRGPGRGPVQPRQPVAGNRPDVGGRGRIPGRVGLAEKLTADFAAVPDYRADLARGLTNLGMLLGASGRRRRPPTCTAGRPGCSTDLQRLPDRRRYRRSAADNWFNLGLPCKS